MPLSFLTCRYVTFPIRSSPMPFKSLHWIYNESNVGSNFSSITVGALSTLLQDARAMTRNKNRIFFISRLVYMRFTNVVIYI